MSAGSYDWTPERLCKETVRLPLQAAALFPLERTALGAAGLLHASRVVDLGCGDGSWLGELAAHCSEQAYFVGIDQNEAVLSCARMRVPVAQFMCSHSVAETEALLASLRPDAVVMRFVHQHLSLEQSRKLLAITVSSRIEASVIVIDVDDSSFCWEPSCETLDYLVRARGQRQAEAGGDRAVGRKIAGRMRDVGLEAVRSRTVKVDSRFMGFDLWWSIIAPILYSGVPSTDTDLISKAQTWKEGGRGASFDLTITCGTSGGRSSGPSGSLEPPQKVL